MKKFEHRSDEATTADTDHIISNYEKDGWELCGVTESRPGYRELYFKRELVPGSTAFFDFLPATCQFQYKDTTHVTPCPNANICKQCYKPIYL